MNPNGRVQSFDDDTRRRLRLVVGESPGITRAKQEAELRWRVEQYKAQKFHLDPWALMGGFIMVCSALLTVYGFLWAVAFLFGE